MTTGTTRAALTHMAGLLAQRVHQDHRMIPALVDFLKQTGDLPEPFASEAWLEEGSLEHECADLFHSGGITRVNFNGTVEQFPN